MVAGVITLLITGRCPSCSYLELALDVFEATPLSPKKTSCLATSGRQTNGNFAKPQGGHEQSIYCEAFCLTSKEIGQRTQTFGQNGIIIHQPELKGTFQKPDTMALKPSEKFKISYFHSPSSPEHAGFPVPRLGTKTCTATKTKNQTAFLKTSGQNKQPMISHHNITYISPTPPPTKKATKPNPPKHHLLQISLPNPPILSPYPPRASPAIQLPPLSIWRFLQVKVVPWELTKQPWKVGPLLLL